MRARVSVTDDQGEVWEGEIELRASSPSTETSKKRPRRRSAAASDDSSKVPSGKDFALPIRAFAKRFGIGRSGHELFTLLVAHLARGKQEAEVSLDDVRSEWARVKGVVGLGFATMYASRAKDKAWVNDQGRGKYTLLPDWTEAIEN